MPYLSFDLDAKKRVQPAARAAGVEPGVIAWGLLELWEHVWSSKSDIVGELVIDGCFGPQSRIRDVLVAYAFLEKADHGYRVRGAARYLRVTQAQSDAGKKNVGNLKQNRVKPAEPVVALRLSTGSTSGSRPALPPNTEHRAPTTQHPPPPSSAAEGLDLSDVPVEQLPENADGFWEWARRERSKAGLPADVRPGTLDYWHLKALEVTSTFGLTSAFLAFLNDNWARERGATMSLFITDGVWKSRIPIEPVRKQVRY